MHLLPGHHVTGLNQFLVLWEIERKVWHLMMCEIIPLHFLSNCFLEEDVDNEIN